MTDETTEARSGRDDARSARAEAKAANARAKAMRPWYKKKRYIAALAVLAIIVISVAGSAGSDDDGGDVAAGGGDEQEQSDGPDSHSGNSENPPQNDVAITACAQDGLGFMEATVDVTNNSSGKSNYMIEVSFESSDQSQQFGTGMAFVNNLEPGQKKAESVSALEEPTGEFTCRITDVNRMAS